jgi:hypothetical protein
MSDFIKMPLVGAEMLQVGGHTVRQTGGETDMKKLRVAFRNVVNVPKKLMPCQYFTLFLFMFILKLHLLKLKTSISMALKTAR